MYKIAICEDVLEQQEHLKRIIEEMGNSDLQEPDLFSSGEEMIEAYNNGTKYSIILLDMQLKELNGIETAKMIRRHDKKVIIIIVTSIMEYAVEGYSINAFDFILKPVDEKKLEVIVKKALREIWENESKIYRISKRDRIQIVKLSDIIYFESDNKKVRIHCVDQVVSDNNSLSELEQCLMQDGFIRISRFFLLNLAYIKEVDIDFVLLTNGEQLRFSRKLQRKIKRCYMDFMIGDM
jgi:DNA-binding LytR/AlgR family response regulator